jgi:lipopolysaccharide export system protein LptA
VQEPSAPEDKRVDLRGEKLHLVRQADGNILTVQGDYGQVQLDKLFIVGPEVTIDQTTNEAWSRTMGVMRLPSNTTLGGTKVTRPADTRPAPPADVTISWQQNMLFDGKDATFSGGVRAEQNNAHLACNAMQVTLDRKVSFREGDKGKEPAKVQHVVCEGDVWVEDSKSEGARIVVYQRIDCPELDVDNDEDKDDSLVHAGGPGTVRIFQLGTKTDIVPPPGGVSAPAAGSGNNRVPKTPTAKSKDEGEFKLTCVKYQGSMHANNKKGIATFRDKVVVIQVPTDDPGFRLNESHLPAGYLYMSCERLEVLKNKLPDGKTYQEMRAYGKVAIETQEFSGSADVVKYDESKEQVILEGSAGNLAVLEQQKVRGADGQILRGKKITYLRLTGEVHVEDGRGVRFSQ